MNRLTRLVAFLFFGSGVCALIYEVAWFREFRLVFGASTLANAAVLAVFIGGLGAGGLVIGKRADRAERPLVLYAQLEAGAAVLAALSPLLLWIMRKAYIAAGGTPVLGAFGATIVRLVLTVIVLLGPTFLMGGTLPAAARAVESDDDSARRRVGLLYGANALGAVVGCLLANFVMLELFGTRTTLWATSAFNLLVAGLARAMAPARVTANAAAPVSLQDVLSNDAPTPVAVPLSAPLKEATASTNEAPVASGARTPGSMAAAEEPPSVSPTSTDEPLTAAPDAMKTPVIATATPAPSSAPELVATAEAMEGHRAIGEVTGTNSAVVAATSAPSGDGVAESAVRSRDAVPIAVRTMNGQSDMTSDDGGARAVDSTTANAAATSVSKSAETASATAATQRSIAVPNAGRVAAIAAHGGYPSWFVPFAAGAVGFVFFLMELVWYRMLGPLLGGTVFTFGIILAVALLGIGIGGTLYALFGSDKPATLHAFAVTCLLEAILLAIPFALGDRIATLALLLRPLGSLYFSGTIAGWAIVTLVVVLPASIVAGAQFPLLIALMGQGTKEVGAQTGWVYAANTGGSIVGSLAGGFGLLPALSVLGCWKLAGGLLALVGLAAAAGTLKRWADAPFRAMWTLLGVVAVFLLLRTEGPTAVWRHSPIGVGRVPAETTTSINTFRDWMNSERRGMKWEADGVESTVALDGRHGFAFIVNGKSDGHAVIDGPTQVMGGLVGAVLHPPKRALVIGLGTGSTAGWLGALPQMDRVDVAELEPAILHVAEVASLTNHHVLNNPLVHINIGDAREQLLTTRTKYDLIFSEPSNPYRAGVASLYTRDYYEACADRLAEDGLFLQWVQAYDIDKRTLRAVYATLGSVFPEIETWELATNDLLLVASKKPIHYDLASIRAQLAREPLRSAMLSAWRAVDAEGFFSHYVANAAFGRIIAEANRDGVATDDRNSIEFGFARTANAVRGSEAAEVRLIARNNGQHRPVGVDKGLDWERVDDGWVSFLAACNAPVAAHPQMNEGQRRRVAAFGQFLMGMPQMALGQWRAQKRDPIDPTEVAMIAHSLAEDADEAALPLIDRLRPVKPAEAAAILARLRLRQDKLQETAAALETAFVAYRSEPWSWPFVMSMAIESAKELTAKNPDMMALMHEALSRPFALNMFDDTRRATVLALDLVRKLDSGCIEILRAFEPYVPWREELLTWRTRCYSMAHHPEQERAQMELDEFNRNLPMPFGKGLDFVRAGP